MNFSLLNCANALQSWFNYVSNCLPVRLVRRSFSVGGSFFGEGGSVSNDWVSKVQITTKLIGLSIILGKN